MTPAEVLARHSRMTYDGNTILFQSRPKCEVCSDPWPCDAVEMANLLQAATERVARLEAGLDEARLRLICVPYHANPKIPVGEPFGYPVEGHREYSCPVCLTLSEMDYLLGPFDYAQIAALAQPAGEPPGDAK